MLLRLNKIQAKYADSLSRKLALGACDRELELPRQPAKLLGGSSRGGLEHWSRGGKLRHSVRGRVPQGSAFGCSRGAPPGSLRERPESRRERGPARSARFFWERWERVACFFSGAHGPPPSLQLSLALSLSPESSVHVRRALLRIKEHQGARATRGH